MGISVRRFLSLFPFVLIGVLSPCSAWAQVHAASIAGVVFDPLGGALSGAKVSLLRDGTALAKTQTDTQGRFSFERLAEGRYQVAVEAEGFTTRTLDPFAVVGAVKLSITLQLGVQQDVLVTASATETPASQVGAAATVIDSGTMDTLEKPDVLEALRLVPGTNVVQTGARGGVTSLYVRGGNDDFNKVLFDGVAANDIGGAFDFSEVATAGVDRVEMLRNPNSSIIDAQLTKVLDEQPRTGRRLCSLLIARGLIDFDDGAKSRQCCRPSSSLPTSTTATGATAGGCSCRRACSRGRRGRS